MTMSCPFKHTNILPLYYQTSPTPYTLDHMPPVDTLLTLGLIGALYILVLVCLLQNTKFRKKQHGTQDVTSKIYHTPTFFQTPMGSDSSNIRIKAQIYHACVEDWILSFF